MKYLGAVALALLVVQPVSAQTMDGMRVSVEPASITTTLGSTEEIRVTVHNDTDARIGPIAVHIDITDPRSETSVDPEDWTPFLTREVASLDPGEVQVLRWEIQPISSGSFSLYGVVLAPDAAELAASNVVTIDVEMTRTLNPEGVLPVAIGMPLIVGALLVANTRRHRTLRRRDT